jgi:hypothetical protein
MSNEQRDELAKVIISAYGEDSEAECPCEQDLDLADAILAAGYRKPRTVTTAEELDALPVGSVILDPAGLSLHKTEFTGWRASNGVKNIGPAMLEQEALPATVLHETGTHE